MAKIKRIAFLSNYISIETVFLIATVFILFYTRFINIDWGLPYPFHPDERNMANALQQLRCEGSIINCFNPYFFAYGQLPLYIGYKLILLFHLLSSSSASVITFSEAVLSLRIVSAVSSIITVLLLLKTVVLLIENKPKPIFRSSHFWIWPAAWIFILSPGLIQFAHFGTTESLLMMFFTAIVYFSLLFIHKYLTLNKYLVISAIFCGLAIGTKISSAIFLLIPLVALFLWLRKQKNDSLPEMILSVFLFVIGAFVVAVIASPHNLISWNEFLNSIRYEAVVATGSVKVFYTQQFFKTVPVFFQFTHIFPYVLGVVPFVAFLLSFILLPNTTSFLLLRISFLVYFIPNAFLYAKWTRFMAPIFPLMLLFAVLILFHFLLKRQNGTLAYILFGALVTGMILPGVAYVSIFAKEDIRFTASRWINTNIPAGSKVLSEGGNVVDLPLIVSGTKMASYNNIPFDFYSLDNQSSLSKSLQTYISLADYIIIPSRRVFLNYTCEKDAKFSKKSEEICRDLQGGYPITNDYYHKLFTSQTPFKKVAEFDSYPRIGLFDKTLLAFPDENAEETWTVFDHPVIRIYKRN